jgi:hypothetical protein
MENDFTGHFWTGTHFGTIAECRENLFKQYQNTLKEVFNPDIPTLVVSHYYKDPEQPRDHDLEWPNLVHFTMTPESKAELCQHLQLPISTPMREVDAIIDYILCTTESVSSFIGCGGSSFSHSVLSYHNNHNCYLVNPNQT